MKAILGYRIHPGVSPDEYERWLFGMHAPDLLANPYLDRLVLTKVDRRVTSTSDGRTAVDADLDLYRIAELQFADEAAYAAYRNWFAEHPIPTARGPAGRTDFAFYVLGESIELTSDQAGA